MMLRLRQDTQYDVVGLGVATLDLFTVVKKFPVGREVQQAVSMVADGGGPVATALVACARLGGRTAMIDCVGDDTAGQTILSQFSRYGVDTSAIRRYPNAVSAAATILVEVESGNRAIYYQPASVPELKDAADFCGMIERAKILHINGRHGESLRGAMRIAKNAGVKISFDGGANRYRESMREIVQLSDICLVAWDFAKQYTGCDEPEQAAAALLEEGPEIVGVTCGARGSYIAGRDTPLFHQIAYSMEHVADTTGCGDSYHGAFLYALANGVSLQKAAALASAVAAINTQTIGGRAGLPDLAQVTAFLAQRGQMI